MRKCLYLQLRLYLSLTPTTRTKGGRIGQFLPKQQQQRRFPDNAQHCLWGDPRPAPAEGHRVGTRTRISGAPERMDRKRDRKLLERPVPSSLYPGSAGDAFASLHYLLHPGPWTGSVFAACSAHLIVLTGFGNLTLNDKGRGGQGSTCVLGSQVIRNRHRIRGHLSGQVSGSLSRSQSCARSQPGNSP